MCRVIWGREITRLLSSVGSGQWVALQGMGAGDYGEQRAGGWALREVEQQRPAGRNGGIYVRGQLVFLNYHRAGLLSRLEGQGLQGPPSDL